MAADVSGCKPFFRAGGGGALQDPSWSLFPSKRGLAWLRGGASCFGGSSGGGEGSLHVVV